MTGPGRRPGKRPGERLRRLAAAVCSARALERLVDPAIADLHFEYAAAWLQGRRWRARWIYLLGVAALLQVVALHLGDRALHPERTRGPHDHGWRSAIAGAVLVVCGVTALMAAGTLSHAPRSAASVKLALLLLPSLLPLTIPAGFAMAIVLALPSRRQARRAAPVLLTVAITFSVAALVTLGWATPVANQAYRVSVFGGPLAKGLNELTLPELTRRLADDSTRLASAAHTARPTAQTDAAMSLQSRIAVSFVAVPLCLVAVALCGGRRPRRAAGLILVCCGYFIFSQWVTAPGHAFGALPIVIAAWLPNAGITAAALLLWRLAGGPPADDEARA